MASSPVPVVISVPEWNCTLDSSVEIVIDESNIKATEAILYMPVADFMGMFVTNEGTEGLRFKETAVATLTNALQSQSVFFNISGNSGSTAPPSLMDSFVVPSASSVTESNLNLVEQNLLKNTLESLKFVNAFIAFSHESRKASLTESIGMGQKCIEHIFDSFSPENNRGPILAKRIFSDLHNEREIDGLDEAFVAGDRITFLVNLKPSDQNKDFVEQNFRCAIELSSNTIQATPYSVLGNDSFRVFKDADYTGAYGDAQSDFTYTQVTSVNGITLTSTSNE
jgi:hypothetical protein